MSAYAAAGPGGPRDPWWFLLWVLVCPLLLLVAVFTPWQGPRA